MRTLNGPGPQFEVRFRSSGMLGSEATVIVPQYGRSELTVRCLRSLRREEVVRWPVVVVDDGSPAGCRREMVRRVARPDQRDGRGRRSLKPRPSRTQGVPPGRREVVREGLEGVRMVGQPRRGVSAAWNLGAEFAESAVLVFLNNDVVLRGRVVERLIEPLKWGDALLAGVRLRRERGVPSDVLRRLPTEEFLEGWCLAVSAEWFRELGGFDESMVLYWSDTDFQARLLRRAGGGSDRLVCVPELPLRHSGHGTARRLGDRRRIWRRDRGRFVEKWRGLSRSLSVVPPGLKPSFSLAPQQ